MSGEDFEEIVLLYERPIYQFIRHLVRQREDAEDLTQETFLKLYRNRKKIDPKKSLRAYLYKIATTTVYDSWRKKRSHPELFLIDSHNAPFETIDNTAAYNFEEGIRRQDLAKAMARIRPEYQSVILLFYYEDFQYHEIADILEIPLNTVKTFISRGKKELKQEYLNTILS